jgi:hypothetical protein
MSIKLSMDEGSLNWGLASAIDVARNHPGADAANIVRNTVQSMLGRNMIKVERITVVGLTEHAEPVEETVITTTTTRTTQVEYEGCAEPKL